MTTKTTMQTNDGKRAIAGFFRQLWIMIWKNWILTKRNIVGTLGECILAFVFILIILMIRVFIDADYYAVQTNNETNILSQFNASQGQYLVLYYPDNNYIKGVVTAAFNLIKTQVSSLNVTSKKNFMMNIYFIMKI